MSVPRRIHTKEKVFTMTRQKILLLIICSLLISGVLSYKDYPKLKQLYFVIEMESSAVCLKEFILKRGFCGISQIFFDTGRGSRQQDSASLQIRPGFQKYLFPIPESIKSIRFDPIKTTSILSVKNAGIENGVGDKLKIFPVQSFKAIQQINKMDVNEGVLTIQTAENANDPIIEIGNSSFQDKSSWIDYRTQLGWIYIRYALLLFAIFMGLAMRRQLITATLKRVVNYFLEIAKGIVFWKPNESHNKLFSLTLTYLSCFLFVCLQVLFEVTKPINSGYFSLAASLELLVVLAAAFAIPALLLQSFALLPSHILNRLGKRKTAKLLVLVIPSTILFATFFIQTDEMIYTFFGVKSLFVGLFSIKLLIGFFSLAGFLFILRFLYESNELSKPANKAIMIMLFVNIAGAGFIGIYKSTNSAAQVVVQTESNKVKKPHIVLFSVDGVNAENTSLYGYKRKTTPFLDSIQNEFFISTNFFSNSCCTHGSVVSMYNGKLPTKTLVVEGPAALKGSDQIKHMPYILKELGYSTFSLTTPYGAKPTTAKVMGGFDSINGVEEPLLYKHGVVEYILGLVTEIDMGRTLLEKLLDRISHLSGTKNYIDAFKFVTEIDSAADFSDGDKVNFVLNNLTKDSGPTFIHIHLLAPHGGWFNAPPHFSKGKIQDKKWMTDFYDDAILLTDTYFRKLYEHLKNEGILDNTILIYVSDHGQEWNAVNRIPLAIRFPDRSLTGRYQKNRQMVDIVPTLLKFLGTKAEYDLDGIDMLDDNSLPADRIIIIADGHNSKARYGFSNIVAIICDKASSYNLTDRTWKRVNEEVMPQSSCEFPPTEKLNEKITLGAYFNGVL